MEFTVYLAPKGFTNELIYELGDVAEVVDRLVFAPGPPRPVAWAQNIWLNPQRIQIESISDGANKLKALQRNWSLWSVRHNRRARLIEEQLPAVRSKPVAIGTPPPRSPLGAWTLLERDVIVASPSCSSPFPHGEVQFMENKIDPPNRAYLKLWELFTLLEAAPKAESVCLDLGGSPGGWTWVLASLGCKVLTVDKAPLEPRIENMPGVDYRMLSAFALDPREVGPVDWLFCDVACYPDRLWRLVDRWRTFGKVRNFVCTLKFQGPTDHETAAKFWAFPGSRLVHLFNNKHELTWVLLDKEEFPSFAPEQPDTGGADAANLGEFGMPVDEA
ncbi:SAM-dependent methyltransferase [Fundidesulfovibrio putealis]|uniref:SAM-dependent methyltransferase n=1 Tax=Fundidesulfovibrio putealis TaxID=270496 RepID=UPI000425A13E|nr:SAM-dependent methyltransferase [Fundidesulfovibrio putealis]